MKTLLIAAIRAYQFLLSPWIGGSCRFWPTCSEYARESIERHGALRGSWMTIARLARCHPRGGGGVDPVPEQFRWRCWCDTGHPHARDPREAARVSTKT
ncbi:MAG: membrane protein insertion efficiency factor YidD [Gemmatimonadota bacterium]